ncbi:hypothetical protein ALC53_03183, partial [Atta colombica]
KLVVFGGGHNGGILSRSLCYTSCVPEGKHVGQKDDTQICICEPHLIALRGSVKHVKSFDTLEQKKGKKHSIRLPSLNLVYTLRDEERRGEKRNGSSEIKRQRKIEKRRKRKRERQTEGASFEKSLMESLGSGMAKCLAKQRGFVNKRVNVIKCYICDKPDKGWKGQQNDEEMTGV